MSHLSKPQAVVLGMGRFAIAMTPKLWLIYGDSFFSGNFGAARKHDPRKIKAVVLWWWRKKSPMNAEALSLEERG